MLDGPVSIAMIRSGLVPMTFVADTCFRFIPQP
jgi:hypothetical protein